MQLHVLARAALKQRACQKRYLNHLTIPRQSLSAVAKSVSVERRISNALNPLEALRVFAQALLTLGENNCNRRYTLFRREQARAGC